MTKATVLTDRFDRALLYATHVHGGQIRKGTATPYVAHLLAVAATVLEYGGDEDLAMSDLRKRGVIEQRLQSYVLKDIGALEREVHRLCQFRRPAEKHDQRYRSRPLLASEADA